MLDGPLHKLVKLVEPLVEEAWLKHTLFLKFADHKVPNREENSCCAERTFISVEYDDGGDESNQ